MTAADNTWIGVGIPSQPGKNLPQDPDQVRMIGTTATREHIVT